jgi:hypothetical protein
MLRNGQLPQEYIIRMLQAAGTQNPMASNLADLVQKHDAAGVEALARNLCESQGKDFDKEFASFKK